MAGTVPGEFSNMDIEDERWDAKLKVLRQITDQILQKKSEVEKKAA